MNRTKRKAAKMLKRQKLKQWPPYQFWRIKRVSAPLIPDSLVDALMPLYRRCK